MGFSLTAQHNYLHYINLFINSVCSHNLDGKRMIAPFHDHECFASVGSVLYVKET